MNANASLDQLIERLTRAGITPQDTGLPLGARDVLDALWLGQIMADGEDGQELLEEEPEPPITETEEDGGTPAEISSKGQSFRTKERESQPVTLPPPRRDDETQESSPSSVTKPLGKVISLPTPRALPEALDIAKALRNFKYQTKSRFRQKLNPIATAYKAAQMQRSGLPLIIPVMEAETEPWFNLELVFEETNNAFIWRGMVKELFRTAQRSKSFQRVRTWRLKRNLELRTGNDFQFDLSEPGRLGKLEDLLDTPRRNQIWLISDGISDQWREGKIHDLLYRWSLDTPVVIVQLLPSSLWPRTNLREGERVVLHSSTIATPSAKLLADDWIEEMLTEAQTKQAYLRLPIITLESFPLSQWAGVSKGQPSAEIAGRIFELDRPQDEKRWQGPVVPLPPSSPNSEKSIDGEYLWRRFLQTASPEAKQLAQYLAVVPLDINVVNMVRDEYVPSARQVHVAEVFASGLIKKQVGYEAYYMPEPVKKAIANTLDDSAEFLVRQSLTHYINGRFNRNYRDFKAFLKDVREGDKKNLETELRGFADFYPGNNDYQDLPIEVPTLTFQETDELLPFTTVFVNSRGEPIREEEGEAYYYDEPLGKESLRMIYIPAGEFYMGTEDEEIERLKEKYSWIEKEKPRHLVKVPAFYLSQTPITQGQWKEVATKIKQVNISLEPEPARFKENPPKTGLKRGEKAKTRWDRPVEQVSWEEAVEYCQRLTNLTGRAYQLPSEAQWEYACRAGTTTLFHFGETLTSDLANYNGSGTFADEPKGKYRQETTPVGQFPPNGFGLYDMHGNVWEWCEDDWHDSYDGNPPLDGSAWKSENEGSTKILRGGSWYGNPWYCRSASRYDGDRDARYIDYGFRVMCRSGKV